MNKLQKQQLASKMLESYAGSGWIFLINYRGLDASTNLVLRSEIRKAGAKMSVIKNKINKIALDKTQFSNIGIHLKDQIAVIYGNDPVSISKIVKKYSKDEKKILSLVSSDGKNLYDVDAINKLADLPSMDVLRAQLLGTLTSPVSTLLALMKESQARVVRALNAKSNNLN